MQTSRDNAAHLLAKSFGHLAVLHEGSHAETNKKNVGVCVDHFQRRLLVHGPEHDDVALTIAGVHGRLLRQQNHGITRVKFHWSQVCPSSACCFQKTVERQDKQNWDQELFRFETILPGVFPRAMCQTAYARHARGCDCGVLAGDFNCIDPFDSRVHDAENLRKQV